MRTMIRAGLILGTMGALVSGMTVPPLVQAQTKPSGAASPAKPAGADALTGTSGLRLTQPPGAAELVGKWQTFTAPGVELSLPENYRGGSPHTTGLQALINGIRSLGADYVQIASMIEQNPNTFLLIAVDPKPDATGGVTNVVVSAVTVPEAVTVDAYIDAAVKSLPDAIRTIDRKTVQVGQKPAGRLVTEASVPSSSQADALRQLIYVIKQGTTLWTVAYSTRAGDYPQRLAMFERSIASFKVQDRQSIDPNAPKPTQPAKTAPGDRKKPTAPIGNQKPTSTAPAPNVKPEPKQSTSNSVPSKPQSP